MTLTLPDEPALDALGERQMRLELACALFARGAISRGAAIRIAGMERREFDEELYRREISTYSPEMFAEDVATLTQLLPGK